MLKHNQGFSLMELSIVLIIVGLLAGGVMSGRSLLDRAAFRALNQEVASYQNSIKIFRSKYQFLPGDFPTAVQVWGRADGGTDLTVNCASPATDISATSPQATCNGNGDGQVAVGTATVMNTEVYRFWQQLGNAGMIPGSYTGISTIAGGSSWRVATVDVNVPMSSFRNGGYYVHTSPLNTNCVAPNQWSGTNSTDMMLNMQLGLTTAQDATGGLPWVNIASPSEVSAYDLKYDDGKPGRGSVTVNCPLLCTDITDTQTAAYRVDDTPNCRFRFLITF